MKKKLTFSIDKILKRNLNESYVYNDFNRIANQIYIDIMNKDININELNKIKYDNNLIPYADSVIINLDYTENSTYGAFFTSSLETIYINDNNEKRYKTLEFYFNIFNFKKSTKREFLDIIFHEIVHSYQDLKTHNVPKMKQNVQSYFKRNKDSKAFNSQNKFDDKLNKGKKALFNILYYLSPVEVNAQMSYFYSSIVNLEGDFKNVKDVKKAMKKDLDYEDDFLYRFLCYMEDFDDVIYDEDETINNELMNMLREYTPSNFGQKFKSIYHFDKYLWHRYNKMDKKSKQVQRSAIYDLLNDKNKAK